MESLSRRLGVLLASAAACGVLTTLTAPVASAAPDGSPAVSAPPQWRPPVCRPEHVGPNWRWEETRRGGHWDQRVWNRRTHRWEWQPVWRDNRRCLPPRGDWPGDRGGPGGFDGRGGPGGFDRRGR